MAVSFDYYCRIALIISFMMIPQSLSKDFSSRESKQRQEENSANEERQLFNESGMIDQYPENIMEYAQDTSYYKGENTTQNQWVPDYAFDYIQYNSSYKSKGHFPSNKFPYNSFEYEGTYERPMNVKSVYTEEAVMYFPNQDTRDFEFTNGQQDVYDLNYWENYCNTRYPISDYNKQTFYDYWHLYDKAFPGYYQSDYNEGRASYMETIWYNIPKDDRSSYQDRTENYWGYYKKDMPGFYKSNYHDEVNNYWSYLYQAMPSDYQSTYNTDILHPNYWSYYMGNLPTLYQSDYNDRKNNNFWYFLYNNFPNSEYLSTYREEISQKNYWWYLNQEIPEGYFQSSYQEHRTNYWTYVQKNRPDNYKSNYKDKYNHNFWDDYMHKMPENYGSNYNDERLTLFYALSREFPDFKYVSTYNQNIEEYWNFLRDQLPMYEKSNYIEKDVNNYWTYLYESIPSGSTPKSYRDIEQNDYFNYLYKDFPSYYQTSYQQDRQGLLYYLNNQNPLFDYESTYRDFQETRNYWSYLQDNMPNIQYQSDYNELTTTNYWLYLQENYPQWYMSDYREEHREDLDFYICMKLRKNQIGQKTFQNLMKTYYRKPELYPLQGGPRYFWPVIIIFAIIIPSIIVITIVLYLCLRLIKRKNAVQTLSNQRIQQEPSSKMPLDQTSTHLGMNMAQTSAVTANNQMKVHPQKLDGDTKTIGQVNYQSADQYNTKSGLQENQSPNNKGNDKGDIGTQRTLIEGAGNNEVNDPISQGQTQDQTQQQNPIAGNIAQAQIKDNKGANKK